MPDIGSPFGVDLATTFFGAGLSLLVSATVMRYGYRIPQWTSIELLAGAGATLVAIGGLLGIVLTVRGLQ